MELLESLSVSRKPSENCRQTDEAYAPLICGLPDDIALLCLARVPRRYHHVLRCVSKRWRDLLCSDAWFSCRRKLNLEEAWIYAICRDKLERVSCFVLDPTRRSWKVLKGLPSPCLKRYGMACQALGRKLYLLGGCGWSDDAKDEVYSYDASTNMWEKAAPLLSARCHFACEVLNGRIHAVGGMGLACSALHSWETFDPCLNIWTSQSDTNIVTDVGESVTLNGKIYIRHVSPNIIPEAYAAMYNPSSNSWHLVDDDMVMNWHGPTVVVDGKLYMLDQTMGTKLVMWEEESKEWVAVGRLSSYLTRSPCRLAAVGKKIFVIGKGLSTVVLDTEMLRTDGLTVSSSIPGLEGSDYMVYSCNTIAI